MRIELIRHGTTALQEEGRYQGVTDAPLSQKGRSALLRAAVMFIICLAVFYLMAVTEAYQTVADLFYAGRPGRENSSLGLGSLLYLVAVFWESVLLSAALIIYNLVKWHTNRKNDEKKAYKKQF